ncbi:MULTISPECIES: depupylase/deamidase Dop [unclassified Arthrobacter]|uniref:depupylase/deamidase Dop n=1 Tax=unclassified Arthrobacter TaxID=235627 RepID=UPI00159E6C8D|nr:MULTISPECIES: depupylase/deamidase Dop [unclassified Arthrobacter]MCQ9165789.1 proteasome accessory factor PafA2 [Arthrobacter sp. STN4]NVM98026.1 proteasome accessory factor PafA2 [Arthrobacter sp. SDTb3-6]
MGAETEYGIHTPGTNTFNATWLSTQVVHAYSQETGHRAAAGGETRWDYTDEDPLADARGWVVPRDEAHPSQLTDVEPELTAAQIALEGGETGGRDPGPLMMNMVLGNGARLYVDHAHPEYSSPEVTNPLDAVRWDAAGDAVALAAVRRIAATPGLPAVNLYKNNTDNKSVSYGSHENYLMPRQVPFRDIVTGLTPFFATRQLICGAGRVGRGQDGSGSGFQISQRADFFEAEVGLETTIRRPIINTRDEPHATSEKYRRLHVIIGDANLSQVSNYLKFGTTALVLDMIEHGTAPELQLADPVATLRAVSHDWRLAKTHPLSNGRSLTALQIQWRYLEAAKAHAAANGSSHPETGDGHTADVLARWEQVLTGLGTDPMSLAAQVEWVAKLKLLQQYRARDNMDWKDPRLALIDLQWSDIRPEKGLYYKLLQRGAMERLLSDADIARAVEQPPQDTRAYFRGMCIQRYGANVAGASWDSVIFELPSQRRLQRVPTKEPLRGTRELTGALFESSPDAQTFLGRLLAGAG